MKSRSVPSHLDRVTTLAMLAGVLLLLSFTGCGRPTESLGPAAPAGLPATAPPAPDTDAGQNATPAPAPIDAPPSAAPGPGEPPGRAPSRRPPAAPERGEEPAGEPSGPGPTEPPVPLAPTAEPTPAPPPPPPPEYVIAADTKFRFRIDNDLSGKDTPVGKKFQGKLLTNLKGEGGSLPSAGWRVRGRVAEIVPPGAKNEPGELLLEITELVTDGGRSIAILATLGISGTDTKGRNIGIIAGGAVAGAILGKQLGDKSGTNAAIGGVVGAAGGAAGAKYAKGRHAKVEKGQELDAYLQKELRLPKDGA